jgi:hypothetical protein
MSDLKVDGITASTGTNTDLDLSGKGTGKVDIATGIKVGGTTGIPVSELRAGTDGELITWDASGNPATVAVGSSTNVLTSNGAGAAPTFQAASGGFTLATEQATTSGTSVTFGSIPAGTKMIIVQFVGVSFSGTVDGLVQIGDSGGIETSGYTSMAGKDGALQAGTTSFLVMIMGSSSVLQGQMMLTLEDASNFTWVATQHFGDNVNTPLWYGAGQKSLSAELTQVKISGGTFDAGAINILYQ